MYILGDWNYSIFFNLLKVNWQSKCLATDISEKIPMHEQHVSACAQVFSNFSTDSYFV